MYDLVIIGGGPAGVAAAVYAARKKIKAVLITDIIGGQSAVSNEINNWIGTPSISGVDLAKSLEAHLKSSEIEIDEGDLAVEIKKSDSGFEIKTKNGKSFDSRFILFTAGSKRRKLGIPGEEKFEGRGVVYCATCDAPLFKNKIVAVVGGGNAGLEAAEDLSKYASKIYILQHRDALKADPETIDKIKRDPKIEIILMAEALEVIGGDFVEGLKYENKQTNEIKILKVQGVFVEIGSVPNTDLLKNLVEMDKYGQIIIDSKTQKTSNSSIWAAGDATDGLYKQNNIAVGDAVKAVLNIAAEISKK
jgi:alkyl hydroperoxide reductase subunit F